MEYNFDTFIDRRNTYALKWTVAKTELPMWVADMDFPTAPEIQSAAFPQSSAPCRPAVPPEAPYWVPDPHKGTPAASVSVQSCNVP